MNLRLSIVIDTLEGGGAERVILELCKLLAARGHMVDLVLCTFTGQLLRDIPENIRLVVVDPLYPLRRLDWQCSIPHDEIHWVHCQKKIKYSDLLKQVLPSWPLGLKVLPRRSNRYVVSSLSLARYFSEHRPYLVMTVLAQSLHCSITAREICRLPIPIICSLRGGENLRGEMVFRKLLHRADWVHTVSDGLRSEIIADGKYTNQRMSTIFNPSNRREIQELGEKKLRHPWVDIHGELSHKIILAVGRLVPQKNYRLLIKAFARVKDIVDAKLIIIGEGCEREQLEQLVVEMHLNEHVSMPGWSRNPYAFMKVCDLFVLSSNSEGLPNVIIEALQLGCNIVSTDCPHGPREILDDGRIGTLVPLRNEIALTDGMLAALEKKPDVSAMLARAKDFEPDTIAAQFENLFNTVLNYRPTDIPYIR